MLQDARTATRGRSRRQDDQGTQLQTVVLTVCVHSLRGVRALRRGMCIQRYGSYHTPIRRGRSLFLAVPDVKKLHKGSNGQREVLQMHGGSRILQMTPRKTSLSRWESVTLNAP